MAEILFPSGSTCDIYQYGWQSTGCTNSSGVTRGFTQEWYFDGDLASWVAITEEIEIPVGATGDLVFVDASGFSSSNKLNYSTDNNNLQMTGYISTSRFSSTMIAASGSDTELPFSGSSVHHVKFLTTTNYIGTHTLAITQPPIVGNYAEMKILMENSPVGRSLGATLAFRGETGDGGTGSIYLDPEINLMGTTHGKMYSFNIWTMDGGEKYFMSNSSGSTYGWDIP